MSDFPALLEGRDVKVGPSYLLVGDPTKSNGAGMLDIGLVPQCEIALNPSKTSGSIVGGHQLASATYDRSVSPVITPTLDDTQKILIAALLDNAYMPSTSHAVQAVDTTNGTFTVSGEITTLEVGESFSVEGSTGNDGAYEATDVSYDSTADETTITVLDSVSDSTADGDLLIYEDGLLFRTDPRPLDAPTLVVIPRKNGKAGALTTGGNFWFPAVGTTDADPMTFEDTEGEDANTQTGFTLNAYYREYDQADTKLPKDTRMGFTVAPENVPSVNLSWSLPADYT